MKTEVHHGDCLEILSGISEKSIDLIYLDPPFFTQRTQKLSTRDRTREFQFPDTWESADVYAEFLYDRLQEMYRVLRATGSLFFHCDRNGAHIARFVLDEIFGEQLFRAEIIWHYRRWSNAQRNLLPTHQNILFYTKTDDYKFNNTFRGYSPTTNVDQILQKRRRDEFGKAVYARDAQGRVVPSEIKKGVPLSDVWDIPFLNPKARERTGYPTQKPIVLLERIIKLVTDRGDTILDPFCGSGTALVAAQLLARNAIGIDVSAEAIEITNTRLANPVRSKSNVLKVGRNAYKNANEYALNQLAGLDIVPIQRNNGIDALLRIKYKKGPVPVRVQRPGETLAAAAHSLYHAAKTKQAAAMILVATQDEDNELDLNLDFTPPDGVIIVGATSRAIKKVIRQLGEQNSGIVTG